MAKARRRQTALRNRRQGRQAASAGGPMGSVERAGHWCQPVSTFTIITGPPNEVVAPIHDRMPVILPPSVWPAWLGEEKVGPDDLLALLRPYPAELMRAYMVGSRVGSVKNNDPALLDATVLAA